MIRTITWRPLAVLAVVAVALLLHAPAYAKKGKSTQNEAEWISYDEGASTVTVKILKNGKGPNKKMLKKGKEATFRVKPDGPPVKTTTIIKINGARSPVTDISAGKRVLIRWIPDPQNDAGFFATGVDVVFTEEELDKRAAEVN